MTTPALSETSQTTGTDPESVEPLHCDPADRGQEDAEQGDLSDAGWAVFQELRPQFERLLPPSEVRDCVDHAVQDLLGSINVEALPEMAIRLAAVRLERGLRPIGQPPGDGPASAPPVNAADQSAGAPRTAMTPPAPPFTVIRPRSRATPKANTFCGSR